ncbi:uncharacterized protein [Diadema antillarum]|uniref:uncharacterized protein n=1 Tax=Diadema antillarum TaxID=105358 RepID=UPI003A884470
MSSTTGEVPPEIVESVKQAVGKSYEHGPIKMVMMNVRGTEQEERILALTEYKMYILQHKVQTKVEAKFNHLQIEAIESDKPLKLKITLPKEKDRDRSYSLLMGSVNDTLDVIEFILKSLRRVFPLTNMERLIRKVELSPTERQTHMEARLNRTSLVEQGPCGGFSHMYKFMCDYWDLSYLAEVAWDVDTIYLSQDCRELRLNDFDDLKPSKHLLPIVSVLHYNTWFTTLSMVNFKLPQEVLREIPRVLLSSQTLECLILDGVGLKWDFVRDLSTSLLSNPQSNLRVIDLSNNPLDDRGIKHLCGPIAKMSHGLSELRLSKTGISGDGASALGKALGENNFIPTTLKVLDLSGNAFRDSDLANLYAFLCHPNNISHLDLSDSECSLNQIFECLFRGCSSNITHLNLSGTFAHSKPLPAAPRQVKNFFTSTVNLKCLNVSRNKISPPVIKEMLESIGFNRNLTDVEIDLSSNELGQEGANAISGCIPMLSNINKLDLHDNGFNDAMVTLVAWIGQNKSIQWLNLGHNMSNVNKKDKEKVVNAMEDMIQNPDLPLHTLLVANNRMHHDTHQLINALGSNTTLHTIDLSGNGIGDIGARLLAKALQINSKLQKVILDNNGITAQGFQDLAQAMERNYTLRHMPIPTVDLMAAVQKQQEKTERAVQRIQELLQRNHSPRKFSNKQAFLLQRGFLYTTAHQMVDKLVVHIEDMVNELTQKSDEELQDKITKAKGLIDDANNSKRIYDVLQGVVGRSEDEGLTEKLREIACLIEKEMESRLESNANGMVDGSTQLCGYVMQDRALYDRIEDTCRLHYRLPQRFVEDLVEQISAETSNQCSETNLAMASFISDTILDEIIEQLTSVEAELADELKKFRDEVASGTTVRQVDSILLDDSRDEESEDSKAESSGAGEEGAQPATPTHKEGVSEDKEGAVADAHLQNGDLGEPLPAAATGGEPSEGAKPIVASLPPTMTKRQSARVQRHKSMKRPKSHFGDTYVIVPIVDGDEPDGNNAEGASPLHTSIQSPLPPSKPEEDKSVTPTPQPRPAPAPGPAPAPAPAPARAPGPAPLPALDGFGPISDQPSYLLPDVRASRPRISRVMRPARPHPPSRPGTHNPGNNHTLQEEEEDISKMFESPKVEGFDSLEPTSSPGPTPKVNESPAKESPKETGSKKSGFLKNFLRRDKAEEKKDGKKSKKEDSKKEKEIFSQQSIDESDTGTPPAADSPTIESKSPRPEATPEPPKEEGRKEEVVLPPAENIGEKKEKEVEPSTPPVAKPKQAMIPPRAVTGVNPFGANVMAEMKKKREMRESGTESKPSIAPAAKPLGKKTSPSSSPPTAERAANKPALVLPKSPGPSPSSSLKSPLQSPSPSPKPTSPTPSLTPTSPRQTAALSPPTAAPRPVPSPRRSINAEAEQTQKTPAAVAPAPVAEVKEEEAPAEDKQQTSAAAPDDKHEQGEDIAATPEEPPTNGDESKPVEDKEDKPEETVEDTKEEASTDRAEEVQQEKEEEAAKEEEAVKEEEKEDVKEVKVKEEEVASEDSKKDETTEDIEPAATGDSEDVTPAEVNDGKQEGGASEQKKVESTSDAAVTPATEESAKDDSSSQEKVKRASSASDSQSPLVINNNSQKSQPDAKEVTEAKEAPPPKTAVQSKHIAPKPALDLTPKPKPSVSPRHSLIAKKPPVASKPGEGVSPQDLRKSLKPLKPPPAKKPAPGEKPMIPAKRPSDIRKANKAAINGEAGKESPAPDPAAEKTEEDTTSTSKGQGVFV